MNWLMWLIGRHAHPPIDPAQIREEMTRADPDFARVRLAQHDAKQALTAARMSEGLALRQERTFWEQHGAAPKKHDDG